MFMPKISGNPELTEKARLLRKNMTAQERRLWYCYLKSAPKHFRRQKIIDIYIVDFYCDEVKLAIEIDGEQHYNTKRALSNDKVRDDYLKKLGITVLRYTNYQVDNQFNEVCEDISKYLT